MEANFFRSLAREIGAALLGVRIKKVYRPAANVFSIELDSRAPARCLLLAYDRRRPLLCLSQEKPENPPQPDGQVMRLRRHLVGARLLQAHTDWPGRRLAWRLSGPEHAFFCLDLRQGPQILPTLDESFDSEPSWPDLQQILDDPEIWRSAPQVTPPLRRLLASLDVQAAAQALAEIRAGIRGPFHGYESGGNSDVASRLVLAWRLPEPFSHGHKYPEGHKELVFDTATQAANWCAEAAIYALVHKAQSQGEQEAFKAATRRAQRALDRLNGDRQRLQAMIEGAGTAELIKTRLYTLNPREKLSALTLSDDSGAQHTLALDPRWSVIENMERLFRQAAKGRRGLPLVEARRAAIEQELELLRAGQLTRRSAAPQLPVPDARGKKARKEPAVQRFRSDDGFLLLRGRNSKANHELLTRLARPYDLWFHAEDGPGAHVILRREHPGREVPARSMEQAAVLAGLRSWQASSAKARVLCALVRDVRAMKGAEPGTARVERVQESLYVALDPGLEARLATGPWEK